MRNLLIVVMTALLGLFTIPGCQSTPMTPAKLNTIAFSSTYIAATGGSAVLIENEKITKEDLSKIAEAVSSLIPVVDGLTTTNNLYQTLYPVAEEHLSKLLPNKVYRRLALIAISQGLQIGELYLQDYPELIQTREQWMKLIRTILDAASQGIQDAVMIYQDDVSQMYIRVPFHSIIA